MSKAKQNKDKKYNLRYAPHERRGWEAKAREEGLPLATALRLALAKWSGLTARVVPGEPTIEVGEADKEE